jgi:hypothetical protein
MFLTLAGAIGETSAACNLSAAWAVDSSSAERLPRCASCPRNATQTAGSKNRVSTVDVMGSPIEWQAALESRLPLTASIDIGTKPSEATSAVERQAGRFE